jgi:hypothetical protein
VPCTGAEKVLGIAVAYVCEYSGAFVTEGMAMMDTGDAELFLPLRRSPGWPSSPTKERMPGSELGVGIGVDFGFTAAGAFKRSSKGAAVASPVATMKGMKNFIVKRYVGREGG